jgi:hypothetical protein
MDSYTSSLRRGYIVELFERHGVFDTFKNQYWPIGNSRTGEASRRRYLRIKAQYQAFLDGRGPEPPVEGLMKQSWSKMQSCSRWKLIFEIFWRRTRTS